MGMFADLSTAIDRAAVKSSAPPEAIADITELLILSAGKLKSDGTTTEYRPYWAAAKFLEQSRRDQLIKQQDQTQFTGLTTPIASLLEIQAALDKELIVPLGFEAVAASQKSVSSTQFEQLKSGYETALLTLKKYLPRP